MQNEGQNYLVPIDAEVGLAADIAEFCISLNWVINGMTECEGCLASVFLEAARGNPFEDRWRSNTVPNYTGLAPMLPVAGCGIAFSAEPGSTVSFEYTEEACSVFTTGLLERLASPNISLPTLMHDVQAAVFAATGHRQNVYFEHKMMQDFCFRRLAAPSPPRAISPTRPVSRSSPRAYSPTVRTISPSSLPPITRSSPGRVSPNRRSPARMRTSSPQKAYSPVAMRPSFSSSTRLWSFCPVRHPANSWADAIVSVSSDTAMHASSSLDSNCVIGIEPALYQGLHVIVLKITRPPEETDAAHSIELISASGVYDNDCPSLTFELPNVQNCVAEFTIDFPNDRMTMKTNERRPGDLLGPAEVSLPLSDLAKCGQLPPFRIVHYMWDSNSQISILQ